MLCAGAPDARSDSAARTHDGLHLNLSVGVGYYDVDNADQPFSGVTVPAQLLIGGTALPGLALGGGFVLDHATSPSTDTEGVTSQTIVALGIYADYYLNAATNGVHAQAFLGWGGLETSFQGERTGTDPTGLITYAGVGYELWLSEQWSYGVLGRLLYAPISIFDNRYSTIEPAVVATLTWH